MKRFFKPDHEETAAHVGRRALVQRDGDGPCVRLGPYVGTIAWREHEQAAAAYHKTYGFAQSAETLALRGGFSLDELRCHLGREPETLREGSW